MNIVSCKIANFWEEDSTCCKKHDPTKPIFPYRLIMTHFSVENIIELLLAAIRRVC